MSNGNQPEIPDFLKDLFQQMGMNVDGDGLQRLANRPEPQPISSVLFRGTYEPDVNFNGGNDMGLMIGVRRDLFAPELLNQIEKPEDAPKPNGGGMLSRLFGGDAGMGGVHVSVKRVAVRLTPEGPEIVDLDGDDVPEDLAQAMAAEDADADGELKALQDLLGTNQTLEQAPRLLLAGEDPHAAMTRATRIGLGLAAYRPVEGMLLRRDAQGNIAFSHGSDAKDSMKAEAFAGYCHLQACVAAALYDKTLDADKPLTMGMFGRRILSGLTDTASLGTNVKTDVTLDRRVDFGLVWMPSWKIECDLPADVAEHAKASRGNIGDLPMDKTRILHEGKIVYAGAMTLNVVRDVLAPVIRAEAEKFLGKDCKWAENAGILQYAVTFADSDADWVRMTVPQANQGNAPQLNQ